MNEENYLPVRAARSKDWVFELLLTSSSLFHTQSSHGSNERGDTTCFFGLLREFSEMMYVKYVQWCLACSKILLLLVS